jgi:hypothetical protein
MEESNMPLTKYQDEVTNLVNRIDRESLSQRILVDKAVQDTTAAGLTHRVYLSKNPWRTKEISLSFSGAAARTIDISKVTGASVVTGVTDRFWIQTVGSMPQRIDIAENYYFDATTLAAALKAALDANSVFAGLGLTFTVTHNATTKKFSIVNSAATSMNYYASNPRVPVRKNSTAGPLFGLTADQTGATITSDDIADIGTESLLVAEAADTSTSYVVTDPFDFDNDSFLLVETGVAAITVTSKVSYQIV